MDIQRRTSKELRFVETGVHYGVMVIPATQSLARIAERRYSMRRTYGRKFLKRKTGECSAYLNTNMRQERTQ